MRRRPGNVTVLFGPLGVGKRQIAIEYVHAEESRLGGVCWIKAGSSVRERADLLSGPTDDERLPNKAGLVVLEGLRSCAEMGDYVSPDTESRVLVTSSHGSAGDWQAWAEVVPVAPWERSEAIGYLRACVPSLGVEDAGHIASALGDLPLALAQTVTWLEHRGTSAGFMDVLRQRPRVVLGTRGPDHYAGSFITRIEDARNALAKIDLWLVRLLDATALLGPDPLPTRAIRPGVFYRPDDATVRTEFAITTAALLSAWPVIATSGLASLDQGLLRVSPAYCTIVRGFLSVDDMSHATRWADPLLKTLSPVNGVPDRRRRRDRWPSVLPLFLSHDPQDVHTRDGLAVLREAYEHMIDTGRWRRVLGLLESLYRRGESLFPADSVVLDIGATLVRAYTCVHRYADAVEIGRTLHNSRAAKYGVTASSTLRCASELIIPLGGCGEFVAALELGEETTMAQRAVFVAGSRDRLLTDSRCAAVERMAGRWAEAVTIGEATLTGQRLELGEQNPDTMSTAYELGCAYEMSGVHVGRALDLLADTLHDQRRTLDREHPDTDRTAAAYQLAYFGAYGKLESATECRLVLERLRREFGGQDRDVYRVEQALIASKLAR